MASTRDDTLAAIYARGERLRAMRRRRQLSLASIGVIACIVAGVVLWPRGGHRAQSVATTPATTVPASTARDLTTGTWSAIPDAPVAWEPYTTQGVWDGHELVAWGPLADHTLAAAAFDPASHSWRGIPAPPLSPRNNASVVWTGTEIVVWGGIGYQSRELFNDGAAYDPVRQSWRPLASSPLSARSGAAIVWTGTEVIVLGGMTLDGTLVDGARYDPAADQWRPIPELPGGTHDLDALSAVWAGDRLVVADSHETRMTVDATTTGLDNGITFSSYDPTTDTWSTLATDGAPKGVDELIWTGSAVLSTPARNFCGTASCPYFPAPPGSQLDLRTETWRTIAAGPADDGNGVDVWTGAALLRMPGADDAAAWDAATDTWTRLPQAPLIIATAAVNTWTGHEALIWGTAQDDRGARQAGLLFTPYTKPPVIPTTPEEVAAQLHQVQGVNPILVPTAVPAAWHADVSTRDAGYDITYTGPNGERVLLSVTVPNPPPPSDTGTQEFGFRGDPTGSYQQQDATDPFTDRYLVWNEPGHWTSQEGPKPVVPYYVSATGVTDAVFWQIAATLTPLPLPAAEPTVIVTPSSGLRDGQRVRIVLTGFPFGRVRLSECSSQTAANNLGCGAQLAGQPLIDLDTNGTASIPFTVTSHAALKPLENSPTIACTDQCVLVATAGAEGPFATAPLSFLPQ